MARVLAISSQVARGHIGLAAIVPALQALGHDVIAFPTVLFSNHPGHSFFAGERVDCDLLGRMLDATVANGWLSGIDAILTGYLPSVAHVAFARSAVECVRRLSPGAVYFCDPVIGDHPKGLYVAPDAAAAVRDQLAPMADVLKCNHFEIEWLSGKALPEIRLTANDAPVFGQGQLFVTSVVTETAGRLANIGQDGHCRYVTSVDRFDHVPKGTGDLMSGLLLGYRLAGHEWPDALGLAVAALDRVVQDSIGRDELSIASLLSGNRSNPAPHPVEIIEHGIVVE